MGRCFFLSALLLIFGACALAEDYPNELEGLKLYSKHCAGLKPMRSSLDDVKKALGEPMKEKSDKWILWYEIGDWQALVYIFPDNGHYPPWFTGKTVQSIDFIPTRRKPFKDATFSSAFKKENVRAADASWDEYYDSFGLVYEVYTSKPPFGDKQPGDLNRISYRAPLHEIINMQYHQLKRALLEIESKSQKEKKPNKRIAGYADGMMNVEWTPQELKKQARELLSTLLTVPDDCVVSVEPITNGHGKGRKVVFQMKIPETRWTMSQYPEVYFPDTEEHPILRVWDTSKADEYPDPQGIAQWFLHEQKDPERCLAILRVWFDANRNKGQIVNYAYDRYAWTYHETGRQKEWLATLEKELELAKAPEALYEIHKHMAKVYLDMGYTDLAINNWQLAQEAMKSQSTAYITVRYALPLLEIAKLYIQDGNKDKAAENLEQYMATSYGKEHTFEAIEPLGKIYESREEFRKARELYMTVLSESYGKNWASQNHLRSCQAPIRARMRLLLATLIEKLADNDGKVRMKARADIEALGKEIVPFLQRYKDDENLVIRGAVQELIGKLQ